jgi:hypothetical protein
MSLGFKVSGLEFSKPENSGRETLDLIERSGGAHKQ